MQARGDGEDRLPVTVVTGFLGAHILRNREGLCVAPIANGRQPAKSRKSSQCFRVVGAIAFSHRLTLELSQ
jgi:hypothetical protein